jgi:hypothetical protein
MHIYLAINSLATVEIRDFDFRDRDPKIRAMKSLLSLVLIYFLLFLSNFCQCYLQTTSQLRFAMTTFYI